MSLRLGGVETGGTTFKISLALDTPTNVVKQISIPTTTPTETINQVVDLLHDWNVDAIGIASFGPIDLNHKSPTYGYITTTPKPNWANTDLIGSIRRGLIAKADEITEDAVEKVKMMKIGWNTDCNAAAAAELLYGNNHDVDSLVYITIGTGIGIGIAMDYGNHHDRNTHRNIKMIQSMLHPEAGHIIVKKHQNETIHGGCPFHKDCLEGLSNNHSTALRAGVLESELPNLSDDNTTWECTSYYVAQLCLNLIYIVSPERIVIGGGLAQREVVMDYIRKFTAELNNGYVKTTQLENMQTYISTSVFDEVDSKTTPGAVGALWLAYDAYNQ